MSNLEDISLLLLVMAERIGELVSDCQLEQSLIENPKEHIENFDYSSKIEISSSLKGELILSVSTSALKTILEKVFFFELDENEDPDLILNSVCEFLNLIAANSTDYMEGIEMPIEIGIPEAVKKENLTEFSGKLPAMKILPGEGEISIMFNSF
ncbi:MAG: chemotaxis protein CheX [Rhodothermaceae bacterium]